MRGLRPGRVFGIQVRLDWSWTVVFPLVGADLTAMLHRWHPTWSTPACAVLAVTTSLLFFASVLTHELAHSLVARHVGIPVRDITLFLFGGVSTFECEPASAKIEFCTAIAGPVASIVLGAALLAVGHVLAGPVAFAPHEAARTFAQLGPVATVCLWLGPVNLVLGAFNLLPGFPLDGGRVLRAAFWAASGDVYDASKRAAGIGRGVAWTLMAVGLAMALGVRLPFVGRGIGSGLWLAFVGWFIHGAATKTYRELVARALLAGRTVQSMMRTSGTAVPARSTLQTFVDAWMMNARERAFPVMDGETCVGMISVLDVSGVGRERWTETRVRDVMTPLRRTVALDPREQVQDVLPRMAVGGQPEAPVMLGDRLVGVLHAHDVARFVRDHDRSEPPASPLGGRRSHA